MTQKVSEMAVKPVEKITRERLRAMRNGDTITTHKNAMEILSSLISILSVFIFPNAILSHKHH